MKKKVEAQYTQAELMAAAGRFGVKPEVVAGAVKLVGKDKMTISEAERAIEKFQKKDFSRR